MNLLEYIGWFECLLKDQAAYFSSTAREARLERMICKIPHLLYIVTME